MSAMNVGNPSVANTDLLSIRESMSILVRGLTSAANVGKPLPVNPYFLSTRESTLEKDLFGVVNVGNVLGTTPRSLVISEFTLD